MQLSSPFLTLHFMHQTVRLLTGSVAIFDKLTAIARFEAIAALAASGTFFIGGANNNIL